MESKGISAAQKIKLARMAGRPTAKEYIKYIFDDFIELAGDRLYGEDASIIGGVASFKGTSVTVIGQQKGRNLEENLKYRFGMPNPDGYRKAIRLIKQAEKFKRPIITFVDTPGAYPGKEAEERGAGIAIAQCIAELARVNVPVISVFIGEGGSGGALALGVCDRMLMLENAVFSILSPEGFASILWKDAARWEEACDVMKMTAEDLYKMGICDKIIKEPELGAGVAREYIFDAVSMEIEQMLSEIKKSGKNVAEHRYKKLRRVGEELAKNQANVV
ncbi:MAG: acetyl-CoA carboxylase carboxyltransferase subunit alpha [Clostridiales bacterium]|nr:acetyl-CoA carboxylase carboxyltransferase subunit alpha [Clostridiales bacterium]